MKTYLATGLQACRYVGFNLDCQHVMSVFEAAEELLAKVNPAENAQLLQWAANDFGDAFLGIESRRRSYNQC